MPTNDAVPTTVATGNLPMFRDLSYWIMVLLPAGFLAGLYLTPVISVMVSSFTIPTVGFANYEGIIETKAIHRMFGNTIYICFVTTGITLFFSYITSYAMSQVHPKEQKIMFFLVILTFWLSILIRTFAWIAILQPRGLINSVLLWFGLIEQPLELVRNEFGVIVGMVHFMMPYAILPMFANMQTIDRSLVPAARALGASQKRAFFTVFFPLSRPGLAGSAILVLILSSGFYITPALLGGGKVVMIAEYISIQISETLQWGLATSLATILLVVVLVLTGFMSRFMDTDNTRKGS